VIAAELQFELRERQTKKFIEALKGLTHDRSSPLFMLFAWFRETEPVSGVIFENGLSAVGSFGGL
jgi:hypothetical protein